MCCMLRSLSVFILVKRNEKLNAVNMSFSDENVPDDATADPGNKPFLNFLNINSCFNTQN